jgi:hypothetical protein
LVLPLLLACFLTLLGCGGGGGGTGGTGVDPIETEVYALLDGFCSSVSARNADAAMAWVDSNLQYFRSGSTTPESFNQFRTRLTSFLQQNASVTLELRDRGLVPGGENAAAVPCLLFCRYTDAQGQVKTLEEKAEFRCERVTRWGIRLMSGFNQQGGIQFPP